MPASALINIGAVRVDTAWIAHRNATTPLHPESHTTPAMIRCHALPVGAVNQLRITHGNALKPIRLGQFVPLQALAPIPPSAEPLPALKITPRRAHRIIPHSKLQQLLVKVEPFPTLALVPLVTNPIHAIIRALRNANPGRALHKPNPANALIRRHAAPIRTSVDATRHAPSTRHRIPRVTGAGLRARTPPIIAPSPAHRNAVGPVAVVTVAADLLLAHGVVQKAGALSGCGSEGPRGAVPAADYGALHVRILGHGSAGRKKLSGVGTLNVKTLRSLFILPAELSRRRFGKCKCKNANVYKALGELHLV